MIPRVQHLDGTSSEVANIVCIGRNYFAHALELGHEPPKAPLVFLKATRSLRSLTEGEMAFPDEPVHHEAELILRVGTDIPLRTTPGWEAISHVALGLDLTRRSVQNALKKRGLPWAVAKSFAGASVVGPLVPTSAFADPSTIRFSLDVNGERRQSGNLEGVAFDVPTILSFLARIMPLGPGDLIYTGTPPGVADMHVGDRFVLRFDGTDMAFEGTL